MTFHNELSTASIHKVYAFEYTNHTARLAASGFDANDIGKIAYQSNDNTLWMLTETTPTWVEVTANTTLFTQTATVTVANTVTETALTSTGAGSLTLPADYLYEGKTIRLLAKGYHSSTANPTINLRLKFGSTVICTTGAVASNNGSNDGWAIDADVTCYTEGASGTVWGQGYFNENHTAGAHVGMVNTSAVTVDTTTTHAISLTVEWGTASASNTITCTNLIVKALI